MGTSRLARLTDADRARLEAVAAPLAVGPGERLLEQGAAADVVLFLEAGEVAIERDGHLIRLLRAPEIVGLLAVLDGAPRSAAVRAHTEVRGLSVRKVDFDALMESCPSLDRALIDHLAATVRGEYAREAALTRSLADFFESPGAVMVPGPYVADPFEMLVFVVEGDQGRLQAMLPPGHRLVPGLGGRHLLTYSRFEALYSEDPKGQGKAYAYREVAPFVPCLGALGRPEVFVPELYPDSYLAIAIGRELYGFPKRFGHIEAHADAVDLMVGGRFVARARWTGRREVKEAALVDGLAGAMLPGLGRGPLVRALGAAFERLGPGAARRGLLPRLPVLLWSRRPEPGARAPRASLNRVPFELTHLEAVAALEAPSLEVRAPDHVIHGRALAGFAVRLGFRFEDARVRPLPRRGRR